MKNILIYVFVFGVIIASFKLPEILFNIENKSIEFKVYKRESTNGTIDVEAEKIYLVRAIHDMDAENTIVAISSSEILSHYTLTEKTDSLPKDIDNIYKELLKLKEYSIINFPIGSDSECMWGMVDRYYKNANNSYLANGINIEIENHKYNFGVESKTGKIIFVILNKEDLCEEISREELFRNYVKYLDLYIIDDWKYENNVLVSKKANLSVGIREIENQYFLFVKTTDIYRTTDNNKNMEYVIK